MNFYKIICFVAFLIVIFSKSFAQESPLWMRYSAISPDGKTILFTYKGDIYSVQSIGGTAVALTVGESYDFSPVWSHDGKSFAFASDRYGNFDVFIMSSGGGEAKRLTYHSGKEIPLCFAADDRSVLFSAVRQDDVNNAQFPIGLFGELYSVPAEGGRVTQLLTTPALNLSVSSDGAKMLFEDIKGYENEWRKHHTSAVTRDIWLYDNISKKYSQLSSFKGEDRNPVFGSNNDDFFYLSEENGSFNVYKSSVSSPDRKTQITNYSKNPVRFLSRASDNTLCYCFDGEIYILKNAGTPQKVQIRIAEDGRDNLNKFVPINGNFSEATLSPNGKEYAYIFRGEIFVSSIEGGITKRITNTPYQERSVSFSSDGRSLLYAAEVNNNWNVYSATIVRKEEPYFFVSTILKTDTIIASTAEEFQPMFSPDAKEVAYLENRQTLKVINLASKQTRTILPADKNYSYADGDQYYQWSPDSKWFLVSFGYSERIFFPEVGLISADGKGELHNLSMSGYDDYNPKWSSDGSMIIWGSNRDGTRQEGGDMSNTDVFSIFLTKSGFEKFKLTKEEFDLNKEIDEKAEKDKKDTDDKDKKDKKSKKSSKDTDVKDSSVKDIVIEWENLTDRKAKLTVHTSPANDWVLSKNNEKLFYTTSFEKNNDIWVTELRTKETKLFAKLGMSSAGMEMSKDGKFIFVVGDGKTMKVEVEGAKVEPLKTNGEMELRTDAERSYIFEHSWRQLKEKFYVEDLQGVDWDYYYTTYKKFLPYINNNYDFAEMLSEMLGEINASHTGSRYGFAKPNSDQTASLAAFYDYSYKGQGLKIAEILLGGPLDKSTLKVRAGDIIEKIDREDIKDYIDFYALFNRKAGKFMLLSLFNPKNNERWEEVVKPISGGEEGELLYKRWVDNRRKEVDRLSNGKLGYIHVRSMSDASMRVVFEEALGRNLQKEALIIDTRFNGGGNIHDQLSDFLNGKKYVDIIPHGQYIGSEPLYKWVKPSIVLMGESNYSDAHLFPVAYKLKNVGKTLGMPVPGTGTFVWWERQIDPSIVFGIPMGGWRTPDGKFCENNQLEPDLKVQNHFEILSAGRDEQIEAAVKEMLK
ncbi:MAG: S41 family peptidase [Candidatus Kapabacteria bacterium]|nr:S41 family peptidase [Candidatus Kapabacteria bacterium]